MRKEFICGQDRFDLEIGRLDHMLSIILNITEYANLDIDRRRTLKHHADDLIGAGNRILELLSKQEEPLYK